MTTNNSIAELFNSIAPIYDRFNHLASWGIDFFWRKRLIREFKNISAGEILDLACGTADVSLALARAFPQMQITGADISSEMIRLAREKTAKVATKSPFALLPVFVLADATCLPFSDGRFQALSIAFGIRNVGKRKTALQEMYRVLENGGKLGILEFALPKCALWRWLYKLYFACIMPLVGGLLSGDRSPFRYFYNSVMAFPKYESFCRELEEVGFRNAHYKSLSGGIAAIYTATK